MLRLLLVLCMPLDAWAQKSGAGGAARRSDARKSYAVQIYVPDTSGTGISRDRRPRRYRLGNSPTMLTVEETAKEMYIRDGARGYVVMDDSGLVSSRTRRGWNFIPEGTAGSGLYRLQDGERCVERDGASLRAGRCDSASSEQLFLVKKIKADDGQPGELYVVEKPRRRAPATMDAVEEEPSEAYVIEDTESSSEKIQAVEIGPRPRENAKPAAVTASEVFNIKVQKPVLEGFIREITGGKKGAGPKGRRARRPAEPLHLVLEQPLGMLYGNAGAPSETSEEDSRHSSRPRRGRRGDDSETSTSRRRRRRKRQHESRENLSGGSLSESSESGAGEARHGESSYEHKKTIKKRMRRTEITPQEGPAQPAGAQQGYYYSGFRPLQAMAQPVYQQPPSSPAYGYRLNGQPQTMQASPRPAPVSPRQLYSPGLQQMPGYGGSPGFAGQGGAGRPGPSGPQRPTSTTQIFESIEKRIEDDIDTY